MVIICMKGYYFAFLVKSQCCSRKALENIKEVRRYKNYCFSNFRHCKCSNRVRMGVRRQDLPIVQKLARCLAKVKDAPWEKVGWFYTYTYLNLGNISNIQVYIVILYMFSSIKSLMILSINWPKTRLSILLYLSYFKLAWSQVGNFLYKLKEWLLFKTIQA